MPMKRSRRRDRAIDGQRHAPARVLCVSVVLAVVLAACGDSDTVSPFEQQGTTSSGGGSEDSAVATSQGGSGDAGVTSSDDDCSVAARTSSGAAFEDLSADAGIDEGVIGLRGHATAAIQGFLSFKGRAQHDKDVSP